MSSEQINPESLKHWQISLQIHREEQLKAESDAKRMRERGLMVDAARAEDRAAKHRQQADQFENSLRLARENT